MYIMRQYKEMDVEVCKATTTTGKTKSHIFILNLGIAWDKWG
jgi:hypothetical protein